MTCEIVEQKQTTKYFSVFTLLFVVLIFRVGDHRLRFPLQKKKEDLCKQVKSPVVTRRDCFFYFFPLLHTGALFLLLI